VSEARGLRASRVKSAVFMPAGMSVRRPASGPLEVCVEAARYSDTGMTWRHILSNHGITAGTDISSNSHTKHSEELIP
jgi:hypothetical protein